MYAGTLTAELRDANPHTHDAIRRLVEQCGGEVVSIDGTTLKARPGITHSAGELLMRHVQKDPAVVSESVAWGLTASAPECRPVNGAGPPDRRVTTPDRAIGRGCERQRRARGAAADASQTRRSGR